MPFRNIGPQEEDNFLAEGMHEEIDAMLSMAPKLMVKDGSRFKEQANDAGTIGKALQVDAIVTGSVRQAGGQLRVIVKLIDSRIEANLWTKTFDKKKAMSSPSSEKSPRASPRAFPSNWTPDTRRVWPSANRTTSRHTTSTSRAAHSGTPVPRKT